MKKNHTFLRLLGKLQPYNVLKGLRYLRHFGVKAFWVRLMERMEPDEVPYGPWYDHYRPTDRELDTQRKVCAGKDYAQGPRFSILVPVYRTPEAYLRDMLESVLAQTYPRWELCLVNADPSHDEVNRVLRQYTAKDRRIRVKDLTENAGISGNTNAALEMAQGDWICLLDHDDLLSPSALYQAARYLKEHHRENIGVVYTDEDKVRLSPDGSTLEHIDPHLKPDFNLDLLRSNNYICHFLCVKRSIAMSEPFKAEFDGAQDYDFIFRCVEKAGFAHVGHVPEILYHWRVHSASTADNPLSKSYAYDAGQHAIEAHLLRCGVRGSVVHQKKDFGFYRVQYPCPDVQHSPLVSVLIPNKDHAPVLRKCLEGLKRTVSVPLEVIIIENNSTEKETLALYKELTQSDSWKALHIQVVRRRGGFNYAAINNFGAQYAHGAYLLLLNNDIEMMQPGWLEEMLSVCARKEVGAVGARLYYPDHTYQHAGIVIGIGGVAGSMFVDMKQGREGYMHKAALLQDLSAVTAACMMMRREVFEAVGGFEEKLAVAFNDVDLCLRLREQGYLVVYDPYAELIHHESKSRGTEDTKQKVRRFQNEIEYMRTRWESLLIHGDPMYNKNLSVSKWNYALKDKERMQ